MALQLFCQSQLNIVAPKGCSMLHLPLKATDTLGIIILSIILPLFLPKTKSALNFLGEYNCKISREHFLPYRKTCSHLYIESAVKTMGEYNEEMLHIAEESASYLLPKHGSIFSCTLGNDGYYTPYRVHYHIILASDTPVGLSYTIRF